MKRPHDQGNMKVSLKFGAHSSRGWVYSHHGRSMAGGRQACCGREQWLRAYMWRHWDRVRANWEWGELFKTKAHPSPTRPQLILPKCPPTVGQTFRHTNLGGLFLTAPHTFRHTSMWRPLPHSTTLVLLLGCDSVEDRHQPCLVRLTSPLGFCMYPVCVCSAYGSDSSFSRISELCLEWGWVAAGHRTEPVRAA